MICSANKLAGKSSSLLVWVPFFSIPLSNGHMCMYDQISCVCSFSSRKEKGGGGLDLDLNLHTNYTKLGDMGAASTTVRGWKRSDFWGRTEKMGLAEGFVSSQHGNACPPSLQLQSDHSIWGELMMKQVVGEMSDQDFLLQRNLDQFGWCQTMPRLLSNHNQNIIYL